MMIVWRCRRTVLGCALGALTLGMAHPVSAQVRWGLGRWQGQSTFFLDWEKQDDKRAQTNYETILFQERIGLRNTGAFIVDPRFLTLNLGGSFGLSQEDAIAVSNNALRVGNGTLYDYAFDGLFFSDGACPVAFFANRSQSTLTQGFGGRSDVTFESRGGTADLREGNFLDRYGLLNFSSFLDVHQEFVKEDSAVFGSPFRRDERRNIVRYHAHKGGETSDADLQYELNDVTDPLNSTNVFDSHTIRATHSLDFGPMLNRRLDSSAYYFMRTGSAPGHYLSVDEGLHIDHLRNLATDYRYDFSQSDSAAGVTTAHAASVGLFHELYRQLTTTLNVRGMRQNFPTGDKTIGAGQAGFDYHRSLPWSGQFLANASGGFQVDDNTFTSSSVDVVDESHTAPSVFGAGAGFTLNNLNVLTDTVVVVDADRARAVVPTSDYDIVPDITPGRTKIVPRITATVMQPNDALEVSYSFAVAPNLRYSTATVDAKMGAEFPWAAASYEHVLSDQTRLAGTPPPQFLINQNLDRFELDLKHQWNELRAQSTAAYEIQRSTIINSNAWRFSQLLAYQPRPDLVAQINGDQYLVDYPGQNRRSNSYLVRGNIDWFSEEGLSVSSFAGYREFHDTEIPSDQIVESGVRVHWTFHDLEVSPSLTWTDYLGRLTNVRGELRLTRRWF